MFDNYNTYECDNCDATFAFHEDFLQHILDEEQ